MPLTPEEVTQMKEEIERLEKLRKECSDRGIGNASTLGLRQKKRSWNATDQNLE